ncbi:MAG TPA: hypothetical protein V6D10_07060 [Trichocoleus sp.]|jgi:hypothetical protein
MSIVDAVARRLRVWVCRPGEDTTTGFEVTDWCSGGSGGFVSITENSMSDDGIISTTATVSLDLDHFDDRFSSWENPSRWAKGNHVIIWVSVGAGNYRPHPRGYFYLLSVPQPPYPGNWSVSLELADWGTYNSQTKSKSQTLTGESLGTGSSFSRAVAFQKTLPVGVASESLGSSLSNSKLNSYQTNNKPAIRVVSELALPLAQATYQNGSGKIATAPISTNPKKRLFLHKIGRDDAGSFRFVQGEMQPLDSITVVGSIADAADDSDDGSGGPGSGGGSGGNGDSGDDGDDGGFYDGGGISNLKTDPRSGRATSTRYLSGNQIHPDGTSDKTLAGTRTESWGWRGDSVFIKEVEEQKARGLCVPQELYDIYEKSLPPGVTHIPIDAFRLIPSFYSKETSYYEAGEGGRLLRKTFESYETAGSLLFDYYKKTIPLFAAPGRRRFYNFAGLTPSEFWQVDYTYSCQEDLVPKGFIGGSNAVSSEDSDDQVRKIAKVTRRPLGQIAGAANDWQKHRLTNEKNLRISSIQEESYRKNSYRQWAKNEFEMQAGQVRSGGIARFLSLAVTKDESSDSTTGNIQPPQAERKPAKAKRKNKTIRIDSTEISATAQIQYDGGNSGSSDRNLEIRVDGLESQEQAQKLADKFAMLYGQRHKQFEIVTPFRDEWFSYAPFSRIDGDYYGSLYMGIVDSVTWTFASDEAIAIATCNLIGRFKLPDTYPYDPLPVLLAADPDPQPLTAVSPDEYSTQSYIPSVGILHQLVFGAENSFEWQELPLPIKTLTPLEFTTTIETGFDIRAFVPLTIESGFEITPTPIFYITIENSFAFTFPEPPDTDPSPSYYWKFEDATWTDEIAGLTFNLPIGSPSLTDGFEGGNALHLDTRSSGLRTDPGAVIFADAHWKITCQIRFTELPTSASNILRSLGTIPGGSGGIVTQWFFTVSTSQFRFGIRNSTSTTTACTINYSEIEINTWYSVALEYFPDTHVVSMQVGEWVDSAMSGSYFPLEDTDLFVGTSTVVGMDVDELKVVYF